jgi:hypothetical protein
MTKSPLEQMITEERQAVEKMRTNLSASHRIANRLDKTLKTISDRFDQFEDDLQPFYKTVKAAICAEKCIN